MPAVSTTTTLFFGWTLAECQAALAAVKEKMKEHGPDAVTAVTVNGNAFSFGARQGLTIHQFLSELRAALCELDPDTYGGGVIDRTVASFRGSDV